MELEREGLAACPLRKRSLPQLKWTGSVVEWVELIYALHASGVMGEGKMTLKKLFRIMGELFDFDIKEFSRTFTDIKNRVKGDRTMFLDKL